MEKEGKLTFASVISGAFLAVIVVLIGVLAFALINKVIMLNGVKVKIFAQVLKVISLFIACMIKVREKNGFIKGALIGALSGAIEYFIFYLLIGSMSLGFNFIVEIIFSLITGAILGAIAINVKK